jgi:trehalose 6-phosphate phosphatase
MSVEKLKGKKLLLVLNFDGTLVPAAPSPSEIVVSPNLPRLLKSLQEAGHRVVLITSRTPPDLQRHLREGSIEVVGLHGLHWPGEEMPPKHPALLDAIAKGKALQRKYRGFMMMDKGRTVALHWRRVASTQKELARKEAEAAFKEVLTASRDIKDQKKYGGKLSILHGQHVMEIRPANASKRRALERLVAEEPERVPVYIGDGATDEEAFASLPPEGLSIRVSAENVESIAEMKLPNVNAVHVLLRMFLPTR